MAHMTTTAARLVLGLGILLALVSVFADPLGLGSDPGFGWKQTTGLIVGLIIIVFGGWGLRRRG